MELQVLEAELGSSVMGLRFHSLTGPETEEDGDLDEISYALIFGGGRSGDVNIDDETKGGSFSRLDGGLA